MSYIRTNFLPVFNLIYNELKSNTSLSGVQIDQWLKNPEQQLKIPAINVVPNRDIPNAAAIGGNRFHTYEFSIQCVDKVYRTTKIVHLIDDVYDTLDDLRSNSSMLALAHDVTIGSIEFTFGLVGNTLLAAAEIKISVETEQE